MRLRVGNLKITKTAIELIVELMLDQVHLNNLLRVQELENRKVVVNL